MIEEKLRNFNLKITPNVLYTKKDKNIFCLCLET